MTTASEVRKTHEFFWALISGKWELCCQQSNWHGFFVGCPFHNPHYKWKEYDNCPAIGIATPSETVP